MHSSHTCHLAQALAVNGHELYIQRREYRQPVDVPKRWHKADNFLVSYIGIVAHNSQGAISGYNGSGQFEQNLAGFVEMPGSA